MAIEDFRQRLEEIQRELERLAQQAGGTNRSVEEFVKIFNELSLVGFEPRGFDELTRLVGRLGSNLRNLGVQGTPAVRDLKTELRELVVSLERLRGLEGAGLRQPLFQRRPDLLDPRAATRQEFVGISPEQQARNAAFIAQQQAAVAAPGAERAAALGAATTEAERLLAIQRETNEVLQQEIAAREAIFGPVEALIQEEAIRENQQRDLNAAIQERLQLLNAELSVEQQISAEDQQQAQPRVVTEQQQRQIATRQAAGVPVETVTAGFQDIFKTGNAAATATNNVNERLAALELTGGRVTSATTELSTGITRLNVQMVTSAGITRRATIALDRQGNILRDAGSRYRTFTGSIIRNLAKVTEWTVAITLTYAPIRALNALVDDMIDLQENLTEAVITVGQEQANVTEIFDAASEVADATASSLKGVVEGYALAFAATSDLGEGSERAAATQQLLLDSMILAQLAGIDQAQALDTLVGALRQTQREFGEAIRLIDSFVAVARNANVSINTLASVFTIAGAAAESAGIDFDELTALAATLAEATKLSADETGNAIRGFISGFQSARAEEVLARFGIATRDAQGEVRDFTDLLAQLAVLSQQEILDADQLREITNAIGGGFRRGAQFAAFLEQYPRFIQLVGVSQQAAGEASEALQLKLETVRAALTRLGNAFSRFAQALGEEGGVLDVMTFVVDILAGAVNVLADLTESLGPATTALIAFGVAAAFVSKTTTGAAIGGALGLTGPLAGVPGLGGTGLAGVAARGIGGLGGGAVGRGVAGVTGAFGGVGALALGIGVPAAVAGGALLQGEPERAGASLAGAAIGGIVGSLGGPAGVAIGSAIGSVIASTFVDALEVDPNLQGLISQLLIDAAPEVEPDVETPEGRQARIDEIQNELIESLDFGQQAATALFATFRLFAEEGREFTFEQAQQLAIIGEGQGTIAGRFELTPEQQSLVNEFLALTFAEEERRRLEQDPTEFQALTDQFLNEADRIGGRIADEFVDQALRDFAEGEIDIGEVRGARQRREGFGLRISQVAAAQALGGIAPDFLQIGQLLAELTDEELEELARFVGAVEDASRLVQEGGENAKQELENAVEELARILGIFEERVENTADELQDISSVFRDLRDAGITEADIPGLQLRANALQRILEDAFPELDLPLQLNNFLLADGFGTLEASAIVTNLLLQDILETEQEQLEGIFNIPEGFVAGLPFTGLVPFGQRGGGAAGGDLSFLEELIAELVSLQEQQLTATGIAGGIGTAAFEAERERLLAEAEAEAARREAEAAALAATGVAPGIAGVGPAPPPFITDAATEAAIEVATAAAEVEEPVIGVGAFAGITDFLFRNVTLPLAEELQQFIAEQDPQATIVDPLADLLPSREESAIIFDELLNLLGRVSGETAGQLLFPEAGERLATGEVEFSDTLVAMGDRIVDNLNATLFEPLFGKTLDFGAEGPSFEEVGALLPESIPVTVDFEVTFQNQTFIDGQQVAEVLEQRQFSDFATATRRAGAIGYEVST